MAQFIEVKDILLNPFNPRDFEVRSDMAHLMTLTESIQKWGIKIPIKVYKVKGSKFWAVLDGVTRLTAAVSLGYKTIYCVTTGEGDCKAPKEMTHIEALEHIFEVQSKNKKHGPRLILRSAAKAHDQGFEPPIQPKHKTMYNVYLASTPKIREMLVSYGGDYKAIGWTLIKDIYKYTTKEEEVMKWIMRYWNGEFNQRGLRKALADEYLIKGM
jgi:hypothetical protein